MPTYTKHYIGNSGAFIYTTPDDRRKIYPNPETPSHYSRNATYSQLFQYYSNNAFEDVASWARYRLNHNLYRHTRQIFNPVTRVIDFYAEHIYPGTLSESPVVEGGNQSAIPFSFDTPEELRRAIGQIWQWSNWQINQSVMVTYGSIMGNVLVEIIDDVKKGKIRYNVESPAVVKEIELDDYGNLESYVIEYVAQDRRIDGGKSFTYAKEVQKDFIAYYKDGELYDYTGQGAAIENPYGFVPAVWVKHLDPFGHIYGVPAIRSAIGKIDELNSIVSHTADHIHKQIESPRIIWTDSEVKPLFASKRDKRDYKDFDSRQEQVLLKGKKDGKTDTLVGTLDPQTIVPIIEKMLDEIDSDYPEITLYEKLREQNIVTAPGAERLMGDVRRKISRPAANYDKGSEKLFQMGAAIGGWRASNGDWGNNLTRQQRKFLPFDLSSYESGDLDLKIIERSLTPISTKEQADEFQVRASAVAAVKEDLPIEEKLRKLGYRDEQIPAIAESWRKEQKEKFEREFSREKLKLEYAKSNNQDGNDKESEPNKKR